MIGFEHSDIQEVKRIAFKYNIEYTDVFNILFTKQKQLKIYNDEAELCVLCADRKMCQAWQGEGYKVVNPAEMESRYFYKRLNIQKDK